MKKNILLTLVLCISFSLNMNTYSYAREYLGKIDFFKIFSNNDENIDRIGNRIYNWSIYMPGDAVVNKNPKATSFDMYTNSYKTNVSITVVKNANNLTLEEIFVQSLLNSNYTSSIYDNSYKCSAKILQNKDKNRYVLMSSISPESYMYKTSNSEEEKGTYNEDRIYLGKNNGIGYIYMVSLSMDLQYYKDHPDLFLKIANSFKTTFDSSNPNIKDLSDQVTNFRSFENKIYGWKIELAPYWKPQGSETSINQVFMPLYSDQEIGVSTDNSNVQSSEATSMNPDATNLPDSEQNEADSISDNNTSDDKPNNGLESTGKDDSDANKIYDTLIVSVVSSVSSNQDFDGWINNEIKNIQTNYNQKLYKQLALPKTVNLSNAKGKLLTFKVKNSSKGALIEGILMAQGNGYRYKIVLDMTEAKYNDKIGKDAFNRMLNSFELTKTKSSFVGELLSTEHIFDYNAIREVPMKNFNLKVVANKNWSKSGSLYEGQIEDYQDLSSNYYPSEYSSDDSDNFNSESITLTHLYSGTVLSLTAKFSYDDFEKLTQYPKNYQGKK